MSSPLYLLDTNILVHYARRDTIGQSVEAKYRLLMQATKPLISYVTVAEIRSFATQRRWGEEKINQLGFLLASFTVISIERPEIQEAYVAIDVFSNTIGRDMGKNDLWIAATARATSAILLTTDKDFDHLNPDFLLCERVS